MNIRQTLAASVLSLITLGIGEAHAKVYTFDFSSDDGVYQAAGTFSTGALVVSDPVTGYRITNITGTVSGPDGGTIAGLVEPATYAAFPYHSTSPLGAFWIDNTYFPSTAPNIDLWGVAFTTGAGNEWNLWANNWDPTQNSGLPSGPISYSLYEYQAGSGYTVEEVSGVNGPVNVTISPVPEPATWAMLLLGFCGIGFMMRGSRRMVAAA